MLRPQAEAPLQDAPYRGRQSLETLYAFHSAKALRLAYLLTGESASAEDLMQEAFIRVASKARRLGDSDDFGAYLRKTIVNRHTSLMRRRKVERDYLQREASRPVARAVAPDFETQELMRRQLLTLPPRQRAALVLRYYEDLSEEATATILGVSRSATKSLVHRGLEALRNTIRGETDEGS